MAGQPRQAQGGPGGYIPPRSLAGKLDGPVDSLRKLCLAGADAESRLQTEAAMLHIRAQAVLRCVGQGVAAWLRTNGRPLMAAVAHGLLACM